MNELYVFWNVFFGLVIILTILFSYLLIRKVYEIRTRQQIEEYKDRTRGTMFKYLYEGSTSRLLLPDHPLKITAMEELLSDFSHVVEGMATGERIQWFAEKFFAEDYRKILFHRRWSIRMNTLYLIEEFRMESLLSDVLQLYKKKHISRAEEGQILKMLAVFDHPDIFYFLTHTKYELSELTYRVIYGSLSEEMFEQFIKKFEELPKILQFTLVDMIGIKNRLEYGSVLESLLTSEDMEIRIRSLKAISQIGYVLPIEQLLVHLRSDNWPERIMAVKICGMLRLDEYVPHLVELMKDRVFQVRSQSAQAISNYPNGAAILQTIINTTEDTFARDMAMEWIERGSERWL